MEAEDEEVAGNSRYVPTAAETEQGHRYTALHSAVSTHGGGPASEVVKAAEAYYAFLSGAKTDG